MTDLKKYISKEIAKEFSRKLPKLQTKTGKIPITKHQSDYGISGNTFRAFRGFKHQPSYVYRAWAKSITTSIAGRHIAQKACSRDSFLKWHRELTESLQKYWKKKQGKRLSFAHCFKCVDLYISWLVTHNFGEASVSVALEKVANCPLDSQILKKLNLCYSNALPMGNPSMGHIANENTYEFCQNLIGVFAENCGGSRLLFDRFAYKRGNG